MSKRVFIAPYVIGSKSAKELARVLSGKQTKALKRFKRDVMLINWGRSNLDVRGVPNKVLNKPSAVNTASDKLLCLNMLKRFNVPCVEHTTDSRLANEWLRSGEVVYGRQLLRASQGAGIHLFKPETHREVSAMPLYTKGVVRSHEYRVHVFGGRVIDVTKKRRRNAIETNDFIKNIHNGWVYCRDGVATPECVRDAAMKAIYVLGLDFGAVDILFKRDKAYVLEINTAPGLQGTTLIKYSEELQRLRDL